MTFSCSSHLSLWSLLSFLLNSQEHLIALFGSCWDQLGQKSGPGGQDRVWGGVQAWVRAGLGSGQALGPGLGGDGAGACEGDQGGGRSRAWNPDGVRVEVRSGRVRLGSEALLMATEAPTSRCRGWLAALLWVLVLPAGMRGSWPVASRAPALAPDETEAQAKEPVLRGRGTEPLAPGAGVLG